MLKEYQDKFKEFDGTLKMSRKTMSTYDSEIKELDKRITRLQQQKAAAMKNALNKGKDEGTAKKKNNKKKKVNVEEAKAVDESDAMTVEQETEKMKNDWEAQKAEFLKSKQKLQEEIYGLQ